MRRSKLVISKKILDLAGQLCTKTAIVYGANLNFRTVNPYMERLIKFGMLQVIQGDTKRITYQTTPHGKELINCFEAFAEFLEAE